MRFAAIVLAAGESSRMGRQKLTLPYGRSTIVRTVVDVLQSVAPEQIVVVAGRNEVELKPLLNGSTARLVVNPQSHAGMVTSIQCGMSAARRNVAAYVIALGDQPQISAEVVITVVEAAGRHPDRFVVPVFAGRRGHPLVIPASLRLALMSLPHSQPLNRFLREHPKSVLEVEVAADSVLADIDTPDEYRRATDRELPQ